jgi:hypothetical protein
VYRSILLPLALLAGCAVDNNLNVKDDAPRFDTGHRSASSPSLPRPGQTR